jgi:hypothetical protein
MLKVKSAFLRAFWFAMFIFCFTRPMPAFAIECATIFGTRWDHNKATLFYKSYLNAIEKKLKTRCKQFDSWESLGKEMQNSTEPLLILQDTHGGRGGSVASNADECEDPERILTILRKLSQTRKVASFHNSCYSGDLLERKLLLDESEPLDRSIDNLCVATASFFSRESVDWYRLPRYLNPEATMRSAIGNRNVHTPADVIRAGNTGMISSLPWRESGAVDYWIHQELSKGIRFLNYLSQKGSYCDDRISKSSACACAPSENLAKCTAGFLSKTMNFDGFSLMDSARWVRESFDVSEAGWMNRDPLQQEIASAMKEALVGFSDPLLRTLNITAADYLKEVKILASSKAVFRFSGFSGTSLRNCSSEADPNAKVRCILTVLKLPTAAEAEKKQASGINVVDVLRSIFEGDNVKDNDIDCKLLWRSTAAALNGFVQGSLKGHTYLDPLDKRRAQACDSFLF